MWVGDVGVNLSSGNIGVAKHSLDGANIGTVHEQISGETMTQSVRGDVLSDAGEFSVFLDDTLDGTRGEAAIIA